jgi:hypothetical protein
MSILTLSDLVTYRQEEYNPGPQRLSGDQLDMLGELGKRKKKKGGLFKKFMKIRKWMPHAAVQRHIELLKKLKSKIGKKKKKKSKRGGGGEEQAPEEAAAETTEEGAATATPPVAAEPGAAVAPSPYFDQPAIVAPAPSAYYPGEFFPPPSMPVPVPQPVPPGVAPSAYYDEPAVFLPAPSGYYPPSQRQMAMMQQQEVQQAMEPEYEEEEEEEGASPAPAPSMPSGPDMGPDEDGGEEGMWGLGFTIPFGSASAAVMRAANKGLVTSQPSSVDAGKVISAAGEGIAKAASAYFQARTLAKQARISAPVPQMMPAPYAMSPSAEETPSKIPGWAWGVGIIAAGLILVNMMKK